MGFYDDIFRTGQQFTGDFGTQFKDLGATLDKFLNFKSLSEIYSPATGLQNQAVPSVPDPNQGVRFDQAVPMPPDKTSFSSSWGKQTGSGQEITGQFAVPGGGYMGLQSWMNTLSSPNSTIGQQNPAPLNPDVDAWDTQLQAASAKYGAPINLLKSLMNEESGGANLSANGAGAVGPMQVVLGYHQADALKIGLDLNNPNDNIMYAAHLLASNYNECGSWEGAVNMYYTGGCQSVGKRDDIASGGSGETDFDYVSHIISGWKSLDGSTGTGNAGQQGSPGGYSLNSFTGGMQYPITQELGPTEFSQGKTGEGQLYGYGAAYGVNGHPGIDVGTPRGTRLTTPFSGTVVCVGGESYGDDLGGGGCGAYDDSGGGTGRIQIRLDNGDHMIFGHTMSSYVRPGQRVNAGDVIGLSGGENGDHVHLEYRKRTPNGGTSSGFTAVDPRTMMGASVGTSSGQTGLPSGGNSWGGPGYNPFLRKSVGY